MSYASWTDKEWERLTTLCRQDGITLKADAIREAAWRYMQKGADGGGNRHGIVGTVIALNVDKVQEERRERV
jgi:hypothetical protein